MISQPTLNASLNGLSALLLLSGYAFIRRKWIQAHKVCMGSAFLCSTAFLVSYLIYHARVGSVPFQGQGGIRIVYFAVLVSHSLLAVLVLPLALLTIRRAWRGDFERHRAIARWTLPIWVYVSFTGVVVYFLLYHLYAPVIR